MSSEFYELKKHYQPCWDCTKACGGCTWSKDFTPIKGWVAEKHISDRVIYEGKTYIIESYKILKCPEFIDERIEFINKHPHLKAWQVAKELKIGLITVKRLMRKIKENSI